MPTLAYFYKLGFLTACADRGMGPDQAEALAERVLAKRAFVGVPAFGAAVGAGLSPPDRRLEGAAQGAVRELGVTGGAALGSLAGTGLGALAGAGAGGLYDHATGQFPDGTALGAVLGGMAGSVGGVIPGGVAGYLLAKKMTPNPVWAQPKQAGLGAAALGLGAGLGAAASGGLRLAGNIGAAAGLGLGHLVYGSGDPQKLKPNTAELDDERLRRLTHLTAELKRRRARLTQTPGLFA